MPPPLSPAQLFGSGVSSELGVDGQPANEARNIDVQPILDGGNVVGLVSGSGSSHNTSSPRYVRLAPVQDTPRPSGEAANRNPVGINIRRNLPFFQLLSAIEQPGTAQPSCFSLCE